MPRLHELFGEIERFPGLIPFRARKMGINYFPLDVFGEGVTLDVYVGRLMHRIMTEVCPRACSKRCVLAGISVDEPNGPTGYYLINIALYFKEKGENMEILEGAAFHEIVEQWMNSEYSEENRLSESCQITPREMKAFVFAARAPDSPQDWERMFVRWLRDEGPNYNQIPPYMWDIIRVAVMRPEPKADERILYVEMVLVK